MRFAVADPPYLGQGQRLYGYPEWDAVERHAALLAQLDAEYDGWLFCCNTPSLAAILGAVEKSEQSRSWVERKHAPLLEDMRIGAWVKSYVNFGFARPVYAWEPVLYKPLRPSPEWDWYKCAVTRQTGTIGAKPEAFCQWVFRLLGADPGDELTDLFPGSGNVSAAWEAFKRQGTLNLAALSVGAETAP